MTDEVKIQTFENVLIVVATNREMERGTKESIGALRKAGAVLLVAEGHSDVSQARNHTLSMACDLLRDHPERTVVLMLDDDMIVPRDVAAALATEALASGYACSAAYATANGKLAGGRWYAPPECADDRGQWRSGMIRRWQLGLGCIAIPTALLFELEKSSESFEVEGKILTQFTWSKAENGVWVAEDFRLCRQLGGVALMGLGVGHVKKGEIWPDDETLAAIREQRDVVPLPGGGFQS